MPADQTSALPIGTRVQISPHLDDWMRGDRFGVVTATTERLTSVYMDRSGRILRFRHDAVTTDPPLGAIAWKCADPVEGARYIFDVDDLAAIRREDPSLVRPLRGMGH